MIFLFNLNWKIKNFEINETKYKFEIEELKTNIVDILDQTSRDNNDLKIENKSLIQKLEKLKAFKETKKSNFESKFSDNNTQRYQTFKERFHVSGNEKFSFLDRDRDRLNLVIF